MRYGMVFLLQKWYSMTGGNMRKTVFFILAVVAGTLAATWSDPYQEKKYIPNDTSPTGIRIHQAGYYTVGKSTYDWQVKMSSNGIELTGGGVIKSTYVAVSTAAYSLNSLALGDEEKSYFAIYEDVAASTTTEASARIAGDSLLGETTGFLRTDLTTEIANRLNADEVIGVSTGTNKDLIDINISNIADLEASTGTNAGNIYDLQVSTGENKDRIVSLEVSTANLEANKLNLNQSSTQTVINGIPLLNTTPNGNADLKSFVNKEYVDLAVTSLGASYYMYDWDDDDTGYKLCYLSPSTSTEVNIEKTALSDDELIGNWISAPGEAPTKLLKGVFDWYVTAEKTSGARILRLYWKLIERKSDDSEIIVTTSSLSNEISDREAYLIPLQLDTDYIPDSESRIVGKLYASVSGGGNVPTVKIYYQGNTSSRWEIPANSEIFQNIFLGINDKAADSELLDEHDSSYFATASSMTDIHNNYMRSDSSPTVTGGWTFEQTSTFTIVYIDEIRWPDGSKSTSSSTNGGGGSGDMTKAIYDTDDDGLVDNVQKRYVYFSETGELSSNGETDWGNDFKMLPDTFTLSNIYARQGSSVTSDTIISINSDIETGVCSITISAGEKYVYASTSVVFNKGQVLGYHITQVATPTNEMVWNEGFEEADTGVAGSSWTEIGTAGSIGQSATQKHTGDYSCKFDDLTTAYTGRGIKYDTVTIDSSKYYEMSAWLYTDTGHAQADIRVYAELFTAGDVSLGYVGQSAQNLSADTTWEQLTVSTTTASNATKAVLYIDAKETGAAGTNLYIDDCTIGKDLVTVENLTITCELEKQ